ncbi:MAG TPA: DUF937 domain-containing protein [Xanthomonadaceae bacterium]|nr:DUF937 domain-containing protein [Xanthomonadaceae bacterium]
MTTSLTQDLAAQLQGAPIRQMSQQLGLDPAQTQAAIGAALPLLLGALGRNASQPQGAEALFGALEKDHAGAGGLGEVLRAVLGGAQSGVSQPSGAQSRQTDGAGILDHIFGARQSRAEQAVGQATGVGQDKAGMLLRWLAPIVLAYLAKRMFDQRQPSPAGGTQQAPSPDVLGGILGEETRQVERQSGGLLGGVLGQVLDRDGDGDTDFSDLMQVGGAILGGQRAR